MERACVRSIRAGSAPPLGLTDLLRLVAPDRIPAFALEFVALTLAEEQVERAASVWDELAYLERGQLSDASLLGRAERLKAWFLARNQGDVDRQRLRRVRAESI